MPATLAVLVLDEGRSVLDGPPRGLSGAATEDALADDRTTDLPSDMLRQVVSTLRSVPGITEIAVVRPQPSASASAAAQASGPAAVHMGTRAKQPSGPVSDGPDTGRAASSTGLDLDDAARRAGVRAVPCPSPAVDDVARTAVSLARDGGHDGILLLRARHALTPVDQVARVQAALAAGSPVAVPALPVVDTISVVENGWVTGTIDRDTVRAVCGPWGFTTTALAAAVGGRSDDGADASRRHESPATGQADHVDADRGDATSGDDPGIDGGTANSGTSHGETDRDDVAHGDGPDAQWRRLADRAAGPAGITVVTGDPAGASVTDPVTRAHLAVAMQSPTRPGPVEETITPTARAVPDPVGPDRGTPDGAMAGSATSVTPGGGAALGGAMIGSGRGTPVSATGTTGVSGRGNGPRAAAVVLAAGSGTRFGAPVNKAYLPLGGSTVLAHSLRRFTGLDEVGPVVLVIREQDADRARDVIDDLGDDGRAIEVVIGDTTRQGSELAALRHLAARIDDGTVDVVALHDSARPLADAALCGTVLRAARRDGGAVPGTARPELVVVDVARSSLLPGAVRPLVAVQTPQAFAAAPLLAAYQAALVEGFEGTDTAGVVTHATGRRACWVPAPSTNLKITYAADLPIAEQLLATRGRASGHREPVPTAGRTRAAYDGAP